MDPYRAIWEQSDDAASCQVSPPQLINHIELTPRGSNSGSAKSSVSGFVDKVTALGDMTKDMASRVEFGGLTKVTLRSRVIPLDLKKAVSWHYRWCARKMAKKVQNPDFYPDQIEEGRRKGV